MSIESLAERAGLDRAQIEAVLTGSQNAGISVLLRLAGALGVDSGRLLDGITWIPREGGGEYRVEEPEGD